MHATVCDYIADLVQNSIEAGASHIDLTVNTTPGSTQVSVRDDGKGMSAEVLGSVTDPFFTEPGKHGHRRAGLGLALLKQAAEAVNGDMAMESEPGRGTRISFRFDAAHPDTPPLGDLAGTVTGLMTFPGDFDLVLDRESPGDGYRVSRSELIRVLGSMEESMNIGLAREFIETQEKNLIL